MVIYGENNFTTDYPVSNYSQVTVFQLANNKDLVLNSIAYLVDRQEDITARKIQEQFHTEQLSKKIQLLNVLYL